MSAPAFTPGPWTRRECSLLIDAGKTKSIAKVDSLGEPWRKSQTWNEREANAHLIAAAPELYEALEKGGLSPIRTPPEGR